MSRGFAQQGTMIHAGWLVRVLARSGNWHTCLDCGARMFVRASSGRCPVCFTQQQQRRDEVEAIVSGESDLELDEKADAA